MNPAAQAVSSILRFDKKANSYKLALVRALNDVALSYPDLSGTGLDVCVPLRKLAEYWLAYYWPFADPQDPVMQGPRAMRGGVFGNDMAFRPALTSLRSAWMEHFGTAHPSLARTYHDKRMLGNRRENVEQAIHHCRQALEVYTREDFSEQWASVQNELAMIYRDRVSEQ